MHSGCLRYRGADEAQRISARQVSEQLCATSATRISRNSVQRQPLGGTRETITDLWEYVRPRERTPGAPPVLIHSTARQTSQTDLDGSVRVANGIKPLETTATLTREQPKGAPIHRGELPGARQAHNVVAHGSGFGGVGLRVRPALTHAPQGGLHPVCDARRQFVGPLVHGLVGDANCLCGGPYRAPEKSYGFGLQHVSLNHSSRRGATMIFLPPQTPGIVSGVPHSTYAKRLVLAMQRAHVSPKQIAEELDITYTGAKKMMEGGKSGASEPFATNHMKLAKLLDVDPGWLATGDGEMLRSDPWPLPLIERRRFEALPEQHRGYVQQAMNRAIEECESQISRGGNVRRMTPKPETGVRSMTAWSAKNHPHRRASDKKAG
jgi:hypothetical protein